MTTPAWTPAAPVDLDDRGGPAPADTADLADAEPAVTPRELLERAWRLLRTADSRTGEAIDATTRTWHDAFNRWKADYHVLMNTNRPQAAILEIIERIDNPDSLAAMDSPPQPMVPTEVRIQGIPLLITDEGPVIHEIRTAAGLRGCVLATVTLICRSVVIDVKGDG